MRCVAKVLASFFWVGPLRAKESFCMLQSHPSNSLHVSKTCHVEALVAPVVCLLSASFMDQYGCFFSEVFLPDTTNYVLSWSIILRATNA